MDIPTNTAGKQHKLFVFKLYKGFQRIIHLNNQLYLEGTHIKLEYHRAQWLKEILNTNKNDKTKPKKLILLILCEINKIINLLKGKFLFYFLYFCRYLKYKIL